MKISGKLLAVAGGLVLIGYVVTLKLATPSVLVEVKEVPEQKWLVLGKSMNGGLFSEEFEVFFKSMNTHKKEMGDSLPELVRYYQEPTVANNKTTSVFSGVIVPDSTYTKVGYQLIEITLPPSVKVQHMLDAGLYNAIDDFAIENSIKLDKNQVVEIFAKDYTAILIQKK
jgi:hypothetical protein